MYVRNIDWPEPCREKIGIRLQVVNVPIIRYISNIKNVTTVEDDAAPIGQIDENLLPPEILEAFESFGKNTSSISPSGSGSKRMLADNLAAEKATKIDSETGTTPNPDIAATNATAAEQIQACNDTIEAEQDTNGTSNRPKANTTCSNATVSTYIEYKQAFEYVISDKSTSFYLYAVVECLNDDVELRYPFEGSKISRADIGFLAVSIDLVVMLLFMINLMMTSWLVKIDSERHKNLLFETNEFSISVSHLPRLSPDYTRMQMKAELWDHISTIVKE